MRLLINTALMRFGGAVQGVLSIINEFRNFPEHEYHVFVGRGVRKSLNQDDFPPNFIFYNFDIGPVNLLKIPFLSWKLSKYEKIIKPDCIVTTSGPSYWHSKTPHLMGYNLPLFIYPESPYMNLMSPYRKTRWFLKRAIQFYFFRRDASAYIVQTDDVNNRVRVILGADKVFTVSNTYSGFYINQPPTKRKLPDKPENEVRLLTPSAFYRHKNIDIIPLISDELRKRGLKNIRFIITIDQKNYKRIFGNKYQIEVINLGPLKPEECPALFNECDIMFLPTLAECFSASYPEAMVMGKPIITTDLSFARNICDSSALYFKPMDFVSAADAIENLLADKGLQKRLIENGFKQLNLFDNATERARKILLICEELTNDRQN
jgi:glycosyltransferase involved in cell wall biosynthesis